MQVVTTLNNSYINNGQQTWTSSVRLHYWRIITRGHMSKITRVLLFVCSFALSENHYSLSQLLTQDLENQHYYVTYFVIVVSTRLGKSTSLCDMFCSMLLVRDMVKRCCFIMCNLYQSIGSFQITHICLKQLWRCIMVKVYYHSSDITKL